MASSTPKSRSASQSRPSRVSDTLADRTPSRSKEPPEVVDPVWLLRAIGVTIVVALVCGYLTLCLLFYQGQWQLVLHPSRSNPAPDKIAGLPFQIVHFGVDESGAPQLTGWFIPAESTALHGAYTILYLPSGDGSLADSVATLASLHDAGVNLFAFDYRGYGQSSPTRPNQVRMTADAQSAWRYLTVSRSVAPARIILYGNGVGASLAAQLANDHSETPAIVLEAPLPNVMREVLTDPRVKWLPVSLLFHENFALSPLMVKLKTPKLFIIDGRKDAGAASAEDVQSLTSAAATPKIIATLNSADVGQPLYREQITRFLDQTLR